MPAFARSFDVERVAAWSRVNPGNAVRALFDRWALPGEPAGEGLLRLGLRNGYLNFYAKGQSVARLSLGRAGPRLDVHRAYAEGPAREGYARFEAAALATIAPEVSRWTETALTYASAEKRFVDDLVAVNPGVIDLEMGLPAYEGDDDRAAPRMDLVVAQPGPGAAASLAFWEAKCSTNGELRSSLPYQRLIADSFREDCYSGPAILNQIDKYVHWMGKGQRADDVRAAYRATARTLLKLHETFAANDGGEPACVGIWKILAAQPAAIVVRPGVVIGNYCPHAEAGGDAVDHDRYARPARSFVENGHRAKLEQRGIRVHEVWRNERTELVLPVLPVADAAA